MQRNYNLLLPIAGRAQRFVDAGIRTPKPMIEVQGKSILEHALSSINLDGAIITLAVLNGQDELYGMTKWLKKMLGSHLNIVMIPEVTGGALETCLACEDSMYQKLPLVIYTPDAFFRPQFDLQYIRDEMHGLLSLYPSKSPSCSYARIRGQEVVQVAEKDVISPYATTGLYYFKDTSEFFGMAHQMIAVGDKVRGEYYIAPIYNRMLDWGATIGYEMVESVTVLGTPEEVDKYNASCKERQ